MSDFPSCKMLKLIEAFMETCRVIITYTQKQTQLVQWHRWNNLCTIARGGSEREKVVLYQDRKRFFS